jgi:hypothetical protein
VATISGSTVTIVGAGSTTISASQSGNANYNAATIVERPFVVGKLSQTITFDGTQLSGKTFGGSSFSLTATGGASGNPVTFTSSDPDVATCTGGSGSTVTLIGGGTCNITASQEGNDNYLAASDVTNTLVVGKSAQTITFGALASKKYGDVPFDLTASTSSGLSITYTSSNTDVATVSGNTISIIRALIGSETCTITASQGGDFNYSAATSVVQTLTVGKKDQVLTLNPLPVTIPLKDVTGTIEVSATSTSGLTPTITIGSGPATIALVDGAYKMTITGTTGTVVVLVNQSGNDNFNAATTLSTSFDVAKSIQSITFAALSDITYSEGVSANLVATASSGLDVTFTVVSGPATLSGSRLSITGAGEIILAASQSGDVSYNPATTVNRTLTVNKAIQNILFTDFPNTINYGDAYMILTATGGASGNPVIFSSSNPNVATCTGTNGSILTLVNAGSCIIYANQAGNSSYFAATKVSNALTIHSTLPKLSTNEVSAVAATTATGGGNITSDGGAAVSARGVCWDISTSPTISLSTKTTNGGGAGSFNSTITGLTAGTTYYLRAYATNTVGTNYGPEVTFTPFQLTTMSAITKTFGDAPFILTDPTSPSSGTFTFVSSNTSVATISGRTVTITGAGSATITATQSATDIYAATSTTAALTVGKANQILTIDPLQVNGSPFTGIFTAATGPVQITASSTSGLPVTIGLHSGSVGVLNSNNQIISIPSSGNVIVDVTQAGNDNYNAASVTQTWDVAKTNQSITFAALTDKTFGGIDFTLSATASSTLAITYTSSNSAIATITGNSVVIKGAGNVIITASQAGDGTYNAALNVSRTLTIAKASQTITFGSQSTTRTFGDVPFALNPLATASSGLAVSYTSSNASVATIAGSTLTIVGAGETTITASQPGNENWGEAATKTQLITINKAVLTVTAAAKTKVYGSPNPALSFAYSGFMYNDDASVLTILPEVATTVTTTSSAGTYTNNITISTGSDDNYSFNYVPATFTVTAATLTVSANAQSMVYGTSIPPLTFQYSGWQNGDKSSDDGFVGSSASTTVTTSTAVGLYSGAITVSGGSDPNYTFAYVAANMTVTKANQTITFGAQADRIYGSSPASINPLATASSGLAVSYASSNPSVATISGSTLTVTGSGTTTITASQEGNNNYNAATAVTQGLTVGKASQSITFGALASKTFGDAQYTISATGGASGNAVIFTSSDPTIATCTGATGSTITILKPGNCTIYANQAGNDNYVAASQVSQSLVVNSAAQTINFGALTSKTFGDPTFDLVATSTSGLVVTFASSNTGVATVSGNTVTIVGGGQCSITASQAGNTNYAAATNVPQTLTIGKATQILTLDPLPTELALNTLIGTPLTVSASSTSGLAVTPSIGSGPATIALVSGDYKLTTTGTSPLTGTIVLNADQAGNTNYESAHISLSIDVTKGNQVITFEKLEAVTYAQGLSIELNASASSDLSVTFEVVSGPATISDGNQLHITGAGTVVIAAQQAGDTNWNPAPDLNRTLTVNKAVQNITFDLLADKKLDDASFTLSASGGASGNPVVFTSSDPTVATCTGFNGSTLTIVKVGTCTIYANQAGTDSYLKANQVSRSLQINPIAPALTTTAASAISNTSATSGGNITSDGGASITERGVCWSTTDSPLPDISLSTKTSDGTGTGSFNSSITGLTVSTTFYVRSYATNSVGTTYGPKISFSTFGLGTFEGISKTFGDIPFVLTNPTSVSSGNFSYTSSDSKVATISGNTVTITGAGTATINVTQAAAGVYLSATTSATLTVDKASQIITLDPLPGVNGLALKDFVGSILVSASASSGLPVTISLGAGSVASLDGSNQLVSIGQTGSVVINLAQSGNSNYLAASLSKTFDVVKSNQTITFGALDSKTYGNAAFDLTASASSTLTVTYASSDTTVAKISGKNVTIIGAGKTTITASQAGNNSYNAASDVNQILTVGKASQTISDLPATLTKNYVRWQRREPTWL